MRSPEDGPPPAIYNKQADRRSWIDFFKEILGLAGSGYVNFPHTKLALTAAHLSAHSYALSTKTPLMVSKTLSSILSRTFILARRGSRIHDGRTVLYRASKYDCTGCPLKPKCTPNAPQRKIPRYVNEHARDFARRDRAIRSIAARA
jgi:hypothetical protein